MSSRTNNNRRIVVISRRKLVVGVIWVMSLVAVGAWQSAPTTPPKPILPNPGLSSEDPRVIFGPQLGFRVDSYRGDVPVGVIVARVDGRWVEVEFAGKVKMAK
jgi:hypothetical protein